MNQKQEATLSKNGIATIQRCEHGTVHIHFRCFSLRLTEDGFAQFASMVKEASSRLMDLNLKEMMEHVRFDGEN
jgi:hypothetical protein